MKSSTIASAVTTAPKLLNIEFALFTDATGYNPNHQAYPRDVFLNIVTGEFVWVFRNDEHAYWEYGISEISNIMARNAVIQSPEHYVSISHLDDEDYLREKGIEPVWV